jgi:hypothetical protein
LTADFVPGHTDLYGISQADVGYSDGTGNHYVNCPPTLAASFAPETVTITELDASHVKGTFSASLIDARTLTVKVTITNGEFYSKF